jgi:hypothetical protein
MSTADNRPRIQLWQPGKKDSRNPLEMIRPLGRICYSLDLLGVPPNTYERGLDFKRKVVGPALLEVNGLSDMGVEIELRRRHARAPVHEVAISWWKKSGEESKAALQERTRSKVGRMARLRGEVEIASVAPALSNANLPEKVERTIKAMREAGAPQADIDQFVKDWGQSAN